MAFQSMVTGADCSTGSNPMLQLTKQFSEDKSLQRDRLQQGSVRSPIPSMRSGRQQPVGPADQKMLDEFFAQEQRGASSPSGFRFDEVRAELEAIHTPSPHGDWAGEFENHRINGPRIWELGPSEEAAMEDAFQRGQMNHGGWVDDFRSQAEGPIHAQHHFGPEFEAAFQKHFDWASDYVLAQGKGKEKAAGPILDNNASWEEQFAAFDAPKIETDDEIAAKIEEASAAEDSKLFSEFDNIWQGLQDGTDGLDTADWEDEFAEFSNTMKDDINFFKPDLGLYKFEPKNPYLSHPTPMIAGLNIIQENGSLSDAALAFEAAVQRDHENAEAWQYLGTTQAQNEKEEPAIQALEQAIRLDPTNLAALMALAVSYTNESYDHAAYLTLEKWITAKYGPQVDAPTTDRPISMSQYETHDRVTELFLKQARSAPDDAMDPDVQVGLGVLFYGSGDYEKAVDCFVASLKGRPQDYLLWNRLGATLANSGRSEDAIEAYHKALEIKPSFVRARYNLGVSCINIGCYQEAAEHLLSAISMHKVRDEGGLEEEGVNISANLWSTLRKTFSMMDRRDLADLAVDGSDVNQFRGEFEF